MVDASAWVAKANPRDSKANAYRRLMRTLHGRRLELVTTTWTLYEALAIIRRRRPDAVEPFYRAVLDDCRVLAVDPEIEQEALRRFLKWADHGASVVDHANLLVALASSCDAVLTFDDDFVPLTRAAGLRLLTG
jgi:predicted nucleic acid-binding protein